MYITIRITDGNRQRRCVLEACQISRLTAQQSSNLALVWKLLKNTKALKKEEKRKRNGKKKTSAMQNQKRFTFDQTQVGGVFFLSATRDRSYLTSLYCCVICQILSIATFCVRTKSEQCIKETEPFTGISLLCPSFKPV